MKILLDDHLWVANYGVEMAFTNMESKAMEFDKMGDALKTLAEARKFKPFPDARICEDFLLA